jgi:predicted transcriptional regulator of viral defense system
MDTRENTSRWKTPLVQFAESTAVFTIVELYKRYGGESSKRSIQNVLYRLLQQKRIQRICQGVYTGTRSHTVADRFLVASKLRNDTVVGFHSALEFHGTTNQTLRTVYYFTDRRRPDVVHEGTTYHSVGPHRQLAHTRFKDFQIKFSVGGIRVTGRERSCIDCLARLEFSGGLEELNNCLAMFPSFDFDLALEYLRILNSPWLYARTGFLLDLHAEALFFKGKSRDSFLKRVPKGVAYLGEKRAGGRWVPTWNLMVPPQVMQQREATIKS